MADACCGPSDSADLEAEVDQGPVRLWQVRELRFAAAAAVFLALGWIIGGSLSETAGVVLELLAAVVAASTFVPSTLRSLRHGRIGVGTLMTIAAIGAVALGQIPEAALLGILFSVAEGL